MRAWRGFDRIGADGREAGRGFRRAQTRGRRAQRDEGLQLSPVPRGFREVDPADGSIAYNGDSSVRRLLEAMHGRLEVHSREGEGSSFIAWLPSATPAAAAQATAQADPSTTPTPAATDEPRLVVLYAEDNEVNIELVRQVLQLRPGCELHVATSGAEALVMAHTLVPDLFLLDMHLGDMTGFELADQLKQDATLRDIPRIAFSADAMPDQIHRARAHGFVGYLTKPLDVEALLDCVDERAGKQHPKMS